MKKIFSSKIFILFVISFTAFTAFIYFFLLVSNQNMVSTEIKHYGFEYVYDLSPNIKSYPQTNIKNINLEPEYIDLSFFEETASLNFFTGKRSYKTDLLLKLFESNITKNSTILGISDTHEDFMILNFRIDPINNFDIITYKLFISILDNKTNIRHDASLNISDTQYKKIYDYLFATKSNNNDNFNYLSNLDSKYYSFMQKIEK